jgi:gamma-glutamyltranspeptidase/glutathione hydrolase
LIQGEANAPAPGRRMLSSMAPTLAWRGAEIVALGGRGGGRIPTAVTQVLLALWQGDDGRAAVARPRLHHQWLPDRLEWEAGALDAAARAELARRGHQLVAAPLDRLPKVSLARRRADGTFEAAGDARGPEAAAVLEGAPGGGGD